MRAHDILKISGSLIIGLHLMTIPASAEGLAISQRRIAQASGTDNSAIASPDASSTTASYSMEDLSYLLAPIALYPDPLLALVLAASTFPVQLVEADAWIKGNRQSLLDRDFSMVDAMSWDSSIQALARFPDEIAMLADHLDWSQSIGMAFAQQPSDVSNAIRLLGAKAEKAGNLVSTPEQNVQAREEAGSRIIYIAPTNPERIYAPRYDTTTVFETFLPGAVIFATGVIVGSAWNNRWGWNNRGWNTVWVAPPVWNPPPPTWRPRPDRPGVGTPPGAWRPDRPGTRPDRPNLRPDRPGANRPGQPPITRPDRPNINRPERPPIARPDRPSVNRPDRPAARPQQPSVGGNRPGAQRPGAARPQPGVRPGQNARPQPGARPGQRVRPGQGVRPYRPGAQQRPVQGVRPQPQRVRPQARPAQQRARPQPQGARPQASRPRPQR